MASDKETIISDLRSYAANSGGVYSQWYVGIATDPKDRLFNDHAVKKDGDLWIYRRCANSLVARTIEKHFLAQGMEGGSGGGDADSEYVYAYRIAAHTVEQN